MTTFESNVIAICSEGENPPYKNITRNLCYGIKKAVSGEYDGCDNLKSASREQVMLLRYDVENILEVINPKMKTEICLLEKLKDGILKLEEDKLATNLILGIPKEC